MESLVRSGKVRLPGSSNYASWQVCRMLHIAVLRGFTPARVAQPMYNLLASRIEDEVLPACAELFVAVAVYNPLAGGLLTGKQNGGGPLTGTRFDGYRVWPVQRGPLARQPLFKPVAAPYRGGLSW
jgi:aryl-alcohol dehydrogenase-like predicted oxidoreductase